ncbi:hypothetical protein Ari01nite_57070 [Paractinoplanes rishiriensis]|uniref:Uncharacterized protein n=1 Tax=Paractinoplanes rishiriensis TaxID=1050105 RepID=A0A919N1Z9_9ACTN|nr:hypothetical protein Ari01nite_57070 [Actinoplanes rishiriensis]
MSVDSMDCSESLVLSNFAATLAITAASDCVWATPDVTPLSYSAPTDPIPNGRHIDVSHHVNASAPTVGGSRTR